MYKMKAKVHYCRTCHAPFVPLYTMQVFCSRACEMEGAVCHVSMFDDPWFSGAIPPDQYGRDYYRSPDVYLGF
ncbi:MAG: hypothetical protein R3Y11_02290 [Pseudomonadota bacterium]